MNTPLSDIKISRHWSCPYTLEELIEWADIAYIEESCYKYNLILNLVKKDTSNKIACVKGFALNIYAGALNCDPSMHWTFATIEELAGQTQAIGVGEKEVNFVVWRYWQEHLAQRKEIKNLFA